jgi:transposase
MPSTEYRDLRFLLPHRHQWVRMRTRVQNALHAIVLAHGVRRGHPLWNRDGQLYQHLLVHFDRLDDRVQHVAKERARSTLLMTHPGVGLPRRPRRQNSA